MTLLVGQLSVWDISFRWAGHDPRRFWFRIPLDVQDHCRNLTNAIVSAELPCLTITLEKTTEAPDASIYRYLEYMEDCISGQVFSRTFLQDAYIDRFDFKLWCERHKIPLPEFWFPAGWGLVYEIPEGDLLPGYSFLRREWTPEEWSLWRKEQEERKVTESEAPSESLVQEAEAKAVEKQRPNQEARIACLQIAKAIWRGEPDRTIASVIRDPLIQKYGGADHYSEDTVRAWIKSAASPNVRKPGRPRKNGGGSS